MTICRTAQAIQKRKESADGSGPPAAEPEEGEEEEAPEVDRE